MPTWWLTDAAMFNPVCAHHVRAGRSLEAAAAGSFVASEVEEGLSPCRHRVRCGLFDCVRRRDGLVLSPTDLTKHLACGHLTTLDLQVLRGELGPPRHVDEALELIFRLGLEHEKAYLAKLRASSRAVVEIPRARAERPCPAHRRCGARGADVVYQATFLDHGHRR